MIRRGFASSGQRFLNFRMFEYLGDLAHRDYSCDADIDFVWTVSGVTICEIGMTGRNVGMSVY